MRKEPNKRKNPRKLQLHVRLKKRSELMKPKQRERLQQRLLCQLKSSKFSSVSVMLKLRSLREMPFIKQKTSQMQSLNTLKPLSSTQKNLLSILTWPLCTSKKENTTESLNFATR